MTVKTLVAGATAVGTLAAAAAGLVAVHNPTAAASAVNIPISGVFTGTTGAADVDSFAAWRSRPVGKVNSFLQNTSWTEMEGPSWWLSGWGNTKYAGDQIATIPMLPADTSTTLAIGATGAYNAHWITLAKNMVAAGMGSSIMRIGWELNGNWYRWAAQNDPVSYAAYFRQIVTAMRSVPGEHFTFNWNVSNDVYYDPTPAYPGDAYVDYIGVDFYDVMWGVTTASPAARWNYEVADPHGLNFWAAFAAQHNKPMGIDEWGLTNPNASMADGGGGGDDPYYIDAAHAWFGSHNVAYECYFNDDAVDGDHAVSNSNTSFPQGAAEYRTMFSAANNQPVAVAAAATTTPAPVPTTTTPAPVPTTTTPAPVASTPPAVVTTAPPVVVTTAPPVVAATVPPVVPAPTTKPAPAPTTTAPKPAPTTAATVFNGPPISMHVSTLAGRQTSVALNGASLWGNVYVFVTAPTGGNVASVAFYIDDPQRYRPIYHMEYLAPFDLAGGSIVTANPYDTGWLTNGTHTITAIVTFSSGQKSLQTATIRVNNATIGSALRLG